MDEKDLQEEELLKEISAGIGKQITEEMGEEEEKEPLNSDGGTAKRRFKKRYIAFGLGGLALILGLSVALIVNGMLNRIHHESESEVSFAPTDLTDEEYKNWQDSLNNATPKPYVEAEDEVINILLIGEEAIGSGSGNGRSDSMMVASINKHEKTLSLTSIMRDCYVKIPGYRDNKLNSAYSYGGGVLLAQTIEDNFGIGLDGYVRVNFDSFEKIIDMLGGVDIELTASETAYLNKENYVSDRSNRHLSVGMNHMNGNQALGYCRVRYKTAGNGENDDFGRTYRQRTVLMAVFNKYKSKNPVDMVKIGSSLMDLVTTNLNKSQILSYLTAAAGLGTMELRTFRVPLQNAYLGTKRYCGSSKSSVLVLDFEENIKQLREFIYGSELAAKLGPIPIVNQDIGINGSSGTVPPGTGMNPSVPKPVYTSPPKATVKPTPQPTPSIIPTPTTESVPTETPLPEPDPNATPDIMPTGEPGGDASPLPSVLPPDTSPVVTVPPEATATPVVTAPPVVTVPPAITAPPAGQGDAGQVTATPVPAASLPPASTQTQSADGKAA